MQPTASFVAQLARRTVDAERRAAADAERRAEPAAPLLLSDQLATWARTLPADRQARGVLAVEIAHALKVSLTAVTTLLLDAGWTYRWPTGTVEGVPGRWSPPWL